MTITATVATPPGTGTATGTVTFRDGSHILGTAPLSSNGQATLSTSALTVGVHTITVAFGGDSQFPANAALVTQTVSPDSTTTVVKASASTLDVRPVRDVDRDSHGGSVEPGHAHRHGHFHGG